MIARLARAGALLAALTALAPVRAASAAADTLSLTLDAAVERARTQAQEVRIADAQISAANGRVREALSEAFPQIDASLNYGRQFASIFQGAAPDTSPLAEVFRNSPFGSEHTWTAELTGSQLIWSGGRVGAGLAAARAYRRSFRANRAEVESDLAFQVQRAYLQAAVARHELDITRSGLEQARAHLTQVALWNREGSRSEYDLIRAQVDAANEEPPVVAAANAAELALLDLKRLLDLPLDQPLKLVTPLEFENGMVPVLAESEFDGSGDLSRRAAIERADAEVDARRQLVKLERSARWPQLTLSGTVSQQAFPRTERPELDQFHRSVSANLKLEFPVFQGLRTFGAVQRASAELRQSEVQRDQLREQVRIEAARARQEVRRTLAEMVARRGTAQLAARAHHLATVRYRNGLSTQLEVSDARVGEQNAEIYEVRAIKDYRLALLELERALGRTVPTVPRPYDQMTASVEPEKER